MHLHDTRAPTETRQSRNLRTVRTRLTRSGRSTAVAGEILADPKRLEALAATALLDTPPEEAFDRLTKLASNILDAPVALVSLVDANRQFFKSQTGLPEPWASQGQTSLTHSFCQHVVASASPLVVADAREHPLLRDNEAIRDLHVIAYLGIPLTTPEGQTLGSFCTIDARPRTWTDREIGIMKELASLVMTQVELRLLARHFQGTYLELRKLELQRDEMVQMLVHDLRNPLSSLLMGLEMLGIGMSPEQTQQYLQSAQKSGQFLMRMISDILDVSKAEAGRLRLEPSDMSAAEIVEAARAQVNDMAVQAKIKIKVRLPLQPLVFRGDREKIRRLLVNLMSNAVQHTPHGGDVLVSARRDVVTRRIIFEIADTGCGIPPEAFGQIFDKYNQPKARKAGNASSGLGLPFCKKVAEAHGGTISVESELGNGTVFHLEIPDVLPVTTSGRTKPPAGKG